MPIDVISDSTITANMKYDFINHRIFSQLRYKKDAVTSFAISNAEPIANMGMAAAGNIAINPTIENHAATAETASAENNKSKKNIIFVPSL